MNADGSGVRRLTDGALQGWLPDGSILFRRLMASEIEYQDAALFSIGNDGSRPTRIIDSYFRLAGLAVDPDGRNIAFVRGTGEVVFQGNLFVVGTDGSNLRQLTDSESWITSLEWSPDGGRLAFASDDGTSGGLFVVGPDGSGLRQLTYGRDDAAPSWSPDGQRIAFVRNDGTDSEIFVMNADGSGPLQLTYNDVDDSLPSWSPDGAWIGFNGQRADPSTASLSSEILVIRPDGADLRQLTNDPLNFYSYGWSSSGTYLAASNLRILESGWERENEVCVMDLSERTCHPGRKPVWLPSGTHILFAGFVEDTPELVLMTADGSEIRRLTDNDIVESEPQWWSAG